MEFDSAMSSKNGKTTALRKDIEDNEKPRLPSASIMDENIKKMKEIVINKRITSRKDAGKMKISYGSSQTICKRAFRIKC